LKGIDMKALSVKQPWATLLVEGEKTVEVRSWSTPHRGALLICASASPKNVFWLDTVDKVKRLFHAGCIIGIVDLLDCRPMTKTDEEAALCDYQPGAYAWVTKHVSFCRPDPISGRLHLFDVPDLKVIRIANDDSDWIYNYPTPQGEIKFTSRCPLLE
jgi:hypothetical protein